VTEPNGAGTTGEGPESRRPSARPSRVDSLAGRHSSARRAFLALGWGSETWVADLEANRPFRVGSAPESDLVLPPAGTGRAEPLLFSFDGEQVHLDPGGGIVFLNGKRHEGEASLRLGDEVVVGPLQAVVGISMGPDATSRRVLTHHEFRERVWEEVARAARSRRRTSLVMLRARPGDGRALAARALETFRAGDVVGNYAEDELELLLPDTPGPAARLVVDRLLEGVGAEPRGVGVAVFPEDGDGPERLLRAAREALTAASAEGATDRPPPLTAADGRPAPGPSRVEPEVRSSVTRRLVDELEAVARTRVPVVLQGEASVGKSVFARLIHDRGPLREGPWVRVLCSAWGRRRRGGARFATGDEGPVAQARGGTLVLDEVTELDRASQALLVARLSERPDAPRIIATAHRDLAALTARGAFDRELAALLTSGVAIRVPSLRERPEDILPLAQRFAREAAGPDGPEIRLTLGAVARLRSYPWFGNVLELRNAMERAVRVSAGGEILAEHLPSEVLPASSSEGRLREHVDGVERDAIVRALADANHNQTHAARRLGLSRRALIYKMEKYGLKPPPVSRRGS
jgi:DNA-binding NtrC family response regulator